MALKNSATDLSSGELADVAAARAAGIVAARAGTAALDSTETAIIGRVCEAARGRGIGDLLGLVLAEYYRAQGSRFYDVEIAMACAATPGILDETRSVDPA